MRASVVMALCAIVSAVGLYLITPHGQAQTPTGTAGPPSSVAKESGAFPRFSTSAVRGEPASRITHPHRGCLLSQ